MGSRKLRRKGRSMRNGKKGGKGMGRREGGGVGRREGEDRYKYSALALVSFFASDLVCK